MSQETRNDNCDIPNTVLVLQGIPNCIGEVDMLLHIGWIDDYMVCGMSDCSW